MIGSRRFEVLQGEAFGYDADEVRQLEQIELSRILDGVLLFSRPSLDFTIPRRR